MGERLIHMAASWRLAAASSIGTSHITSGTTCQDAFAHASIPDSDGEILVAVVCDGAGSAAYSDVGSSVAAATVIDSIRRYLANGGTMSCLTREVAIGWIDEVAETLEQTAKSAGHAFRDYACTLLAVLAGEHDVAFLQVGDGAIVVSHGEEDGWSYVFWPQHGEYANTTNFVVSPKASELLEFEIASRRIEEFAVFSDGIEKLVLHDATRTVHEAFFNGMFPPVRKSVEFGLDAKLSEGLGVYLSSPTICERTDDDKTLILASRAVLPQTS